MVFWNDTFPEPLLSLGGLIESLFWRTATKSWTLLGMESQLPEPDIHREHIGGSFPSVATALVRSKTVLVKQALSVLIAANMIYAADFWDFRILEWLVTPREIIAAFGINGS